MVVVPRAFRFIERERLRIPWRLPLCVARILPVPVTRKRRLTPLLVFSLGILCLHIYTALKAAWLNKPAGQPLTGLGRGMKGGL